MSLSALTSSWEGTVANYRFQYGEPNENVVTETLNDVEVQREDGWVVIFRGREAILRVQEPHVLLLEEISSQAQP